MLSVALLSVNILNVMAPREHLLDDFRDPFDDFVIKLADIKSIKSLSNIYTRVYICQYI